MQPRNPLLCNLSYGHSLANCLSHCLQDNFSHLFLMEERGGIADVVSDEALCGDSYLVFIDRRFRPGLLHSLVSVHLLLSTKS